MTKITVQLCLSVWSSVSVLMYQSANPQKPTPCICWDTLFTANPPEIYDLSNHKLLCLLKTTVSTPSKERGTLHSDCSHMNEHWTGHAGKKRVGSLMGIARNRTVNQFGKREGSLRGLLPLLMLNKKWKPQQYGVTVCVCVCDFWRKLGGDFTSGGRKKIRAKERERERAL